MVTKLSELSKPHQHRYSARDVRFASSSNQGLVMNDAEARIHCTNCGRTSHCGTVLKEVFDDPLSTSNEIEVCKNCRCKRCEEVWQ